MLATGKMGTGQSKTKHWEEQTVDVPYEPRGDGYRVWLFGDSILDNSYWNGVKADTTLERLRPLLPGVEVRDRAGECADALTMAHCLERGARYHVAPHYVAHRNALGLPYDGAPDGALDLDPEFGGGDFLVLSVGGNDFALRGETDPAAILEQVRRVLRHYKARDVKPERMLYITPYPPTHLMRLGMALRGQNLDTLYARMVAEAGEMCREEGAACLALDFFGSDEKACDGSLIPEPTRYGAWKLAKLIQEFVLPQIQREESVG